MKADQQKAFDKFWNEHWPKCRRKDKKKTMDQWARIAPELYETLYAAVDRQKKQPSWNKDDCAFIPYPHRWLRDRRWEDEVTLPEDKDAEVLIAELKLHRTMPPELPREIADRFRRMCARVRGTCMAPCNWPEFHLALNSKMITEEQFKEAFLGTPSTGAG